VDNLDVFTMRVVLEDQRAFLEYTNKKIAASGLDITPDLEVFGPLSVELLLLTGGDARRGMSVASSILEDITPLMDTMDRLGGEFAVDPSIIMEYDYEGAPVIRVSLPNFHNYPLDTTPSEYLGVQTRENTLARRLCPPLTQDLEAARG